LKDSWPKKSKSKICFSQNLLLSGTAVPERTESGCEKVTTFVFVEF